MARAARLKVYHARMGFFDSVVAAPSQRAALEAWGTRQDLFAEGMAGVSEDVAAVEAAMAHPGQVLQRPAGGGGAFELPSSGAALPNLPRAQTAGKAGAATVAATAPKPPDRRQLGAAEAALSSFDRDRDSQLQALAQERARVQQALQALDARELDLRRELDRRRAELQDSLERARSAYRRAGGDA